MKTVNACWKISILYCFTVGLIPFYVMCGVYKSKRCNLQLLLQHTDSKVNKVANLGFRNGITECIVPT